MIKEQLKLLEGTVNFISFSQDVIDSYSIDSVDEKLFNSSVQLFIDSRVSKNHYIYKIIKFYLENDLKFIDICKFKKYPLPAVFNKSTKKVLLNITALEKRSVVNIEPQDLCALILYGHVCGILTSKDKIPSSSADIFSEFFSMIFLKIFSRKYGITGSYADLIPYLRFLISIFVYVSFFESNLKTAVKKSVIISKYNVKNLNIDLEKYDFNNIKSFIKVLNDSQIMPGLNVYEFSNRMIKQFGVINLPLFEDLMRCCSTLFASTVPGNNYFTSSYQMFHKALFDKLIRIIENSVKV